MRLTLDDLAVEVRFSTRRKTVELTVERDGSLTVRAPLGIEAGVRWGSCGQTGGVNFNWQTILLPAGVADYVAVHEQVHLRAPNHSPEFWTRVERVLPDYKQRKEWMAANGAGFVGV